MKAHQIDLPEVEVERWVSAVWLLERGTIAVAVDIEPDGRARVRNATAEEREALEAGNGLQMDTRTCVEPRGEALDEVEVFEGCPVDSDLPAIARIGRVFARAAWISDGVVGEWIKGGTLTQQHGAQLRMYLGSFIHNAIATFGEINEYGKRGLAFVPKPPPSVVEAFGRGGRGPRR